MKSSTWLSLWCASGCGTQASVESALTEIPGRSPFTGYIAVVSFAALYDNTYPVSAVGLVLYDNPDSTIEPVCTATLVRCDVALTADHCFYDGVTGRARRRDRFSVFFPNAGLFKVSNTLPKERADSDHDVAALYFSRGVALSPAEVQLGPHENAGNGKIVGFGKGIGGTPPGLRRAALVTYKPCDDGRHVCWDYKESPFDGIQGTTCAGDSGGPLFDSHGRLLGVHARGTSGKCGNDDHATDMNLHELASTIEPWLTARTNCPAGTETTWGEATDALKPFTLEVPSGYSRLRVGVNAEARPTTRVSVSVVSPANGVLCESPGGHAWDSCDVALPQAGVYRILPKGELAGSWYQLSFWIH